MDRAPTYQDLNRVRAEQSAMQNQNMQKEAMANEVKAMSTPNPVLAEYMNRSTQQGLVPRVNSEQEAYSMAMIDAALKGQVPVEAVLNDERVLPQYREELMASLNPNIGLGQIR